MEYILVLGCVVLPLMIFLIPLCTAMMQTFAGRLVYLIRLPF